MELKALEINHLYALCLLKQLHWGLVAYIDIFLKPFKGILIKQHAHLMVYSLINFLLIV